GAFCGCPSGGGAITSPALPVSHVDWLGCETPRWSFRSGTAFGFFCSRSRSFSSLMRRERATAIPALLLAALEDHEVELRELGLTEREEHLDEQTVRRVRVGDDDRLARARVLARGETDLTIALAPALERV